MTWGAARVAALPAWLALMVQVPVEVNASSPPVVIVQTLGVDEASVTVSPASDVAVRVGVVPSVNVPGFASVITWVVCGVVLIDATDAADVPVLFVAVTANVYEVPLARPVTMIGLEVPVPVAPPGLAVTV